MASVAGQGVYDMLVWLVCILAMRAQAVPAADSMIRCVGTWEPVAANGLLIHVPFTDEDRGLRIAYYSFYVVAMRGQAPLAFAS